MSAGSTRTLHPAIATLAYLGFVLVTLAGYLIYIIVLYNVDANTLVFTTFGTLLLWYSLSYSMRRRLWDWRPEIGHFVLANAFFMFVYWYAFWKGLTAGKAADLALAFLALVIFVSPLLVHRLCDTDKIEHRGEFAVTSAMLVAGIVLIKLNLPWSELTYANATARMLAWDWFPVICFLIAVMAEGGADVVMTRLSEAVSTGRVVCYDRIALRPGTTKSDVASSELIVGSLPVCFGLAVVMLIIEGDWEFQVRGRWSDLTHFFWLAGWLIVLGLAGTLYRNEVINRLKVKHGLRSAGLGPWMAVRVVLYLFAATGLWYGFSHILDFGRCKDGICWISAFPLYQGRVGHPDLVQINTKFVPAWSFTYVIGAALIVFAFGVRLRRSAKEGFTVNG